MPRRIRKAMVLAAGFGARLKPLTDRTPKPLVPVAGKPMIEYALEKLQAYGIEEVIVNVSHLKEQLIDYFARRKGVAITLSEEAEPLETGGGLMHALPFLGADPLFTINSDIIWRDGKIGALTRLAESWDPDKMDVLLLAQSKSRAVGHDKGEDHLFIKPENTIGWDQREAPYVIAGIGIIHPRILRDCQDRKFSVKVLWHRALSQGRLNCLPHLGDWFQTGTIEDIRNAEEKLTRV